MSRTFHKHPLLCRWLLCPVALLPGSACLSQGYADIRAELLYNDNLTRSEHAADAREDFSATVAAAAGVHLQPGNFTGVDVSVSLARTHYERYSGLSNSEAGLGFALTHKFGIGERIPTLALTAGVSRNEFNLGQRDAWIYDSALTLNKRIADTATLAIGLRYEKRDGDHNVPKAPAPGAMSGPKPGNAWDISSWSAFVRSELDIGPASWLSGSYQYQDGDIVSTGLSYPRIVNTATAITLDPLFGPNAIAYRITARTHTLSLDINRAVLQSGTLYLGLEYQSTRGRNGIDYDVGLLRSGFIYGF